MGSLNFDFLPSALAKVKKLKLLQRRDIGLRQRRQLLAGVDCPWSCRDALQRIGREHPRRRSRHGAPLVMAPSCCNHLAPRGDPDMGWASAAAPPRAAPQMRANRPINPRMVEVTSSCLRRFQEAAPPQQRVAPARGREGE